MCRPLIASPLVPSLAARIRPRVSHLVQFAKVAEFQRSGLVHFHALIRLDGPPTPTDDYPAPKIGFGAPREGGATLGTLRARPAVLGDSNSGRGPNVL
ncbi:replication initiator [Microlunatus ginsengisoli]|uniref:replication initiator n=1 Tax=Microlunatus ginsengisoli TaxID=363863 RepID=UPI003CD08031